jgi:hypothetical protein
MGERAPAIDSLIDVARGLAAGGVLLSAVVHLDLWDVERFREIPKIGPLFLLNVIGGCVIGLVMLAWRHWLPALAAAGYGAVTVAAFWVSVVHGLFGFKEIANGSSQLLAQIAEYIAVVFGLAAALGLWFRRVRRVPTATTGMVTVHQPSLRAGRP